MQTQRRLDDILGRDIGMQWFEGVALVQAVCDRIAAHGPSDAFPAAADIVVDADGSIAVLGHTAGSAVASAGHLRAGIVGLDAFPAEADRVVDADGSIAVLGHTTGAAVASAGYLLAGIVGDDVPVRLRLAINEAIATDSPYRHLAAFSEALAYFERPGRRELIAAVYARAAAAPSRSIARAIQPPAPDAPDGQRPPARSPRRRRALVPVLLVAGAVVVAGIWLAPNHRKMPAALAALVPDARPEQSLAPTDSSRAPRAAPLRPATNVTVRAREVTATPNAAKAHTDALLLPEKQGAPPVMVFHDTLEIMVGEPEDAADVSGSDIRRRVYSRADGLVSPPRPVRPQLPPEPPFDPTVAPPTELELVIGTTGVVESAKLQTPPRNIMEFMLVSAAKAWIFQPAELDGHPVVYRHRVRLILP